MRISGVPLDIKPPIIITAPSSIDATASFADTGKRPGDSGFGITATGATVRKGIIAVDPRVIPLGTRVYVEVLGSAADYGYAVAADVGGAIKGNKIDVYLTSTGAVNAWGVKKVKVYVLK